jgi:two-component system, OmpR family, response regulator
VQHGRHVILVVDDDPEVRDVMGLILARHGYVAVTAASAEEGLRQYKASQPDLVIVDLMMEEVDSGTGLVKDLRLLGNSAPVFMLSSVGDALHRTIDTTALGLQGVFQKPIDPATLLSTLEGQLGTPG